MDNYSKQEEAESVVQVYEAEKAQEKRKTVSDEIQNLADILLDDATGLTWDLYRLDQRDKLDLKIRMALFPESVKVKECGKEVINENYIMISSYC